jgi:hypothetical protein
MSRPQDMLPRWARRRKGGLWFAAVFALLVAGTIITYVRKYSTPANYPYDLRITSVRIVRQILPQGSFAGPARNPYIDWLRIDMTSAFDIESYALSYKLNVWYEASPCKRNGVDPAQLMLGYNDVHDGFGETTIWSVESDGITYRTKPGGPRLPSGKIPYHVFIPVKLLTPNLHPAVYNYDLLHRPVSICLVLRSAGNFWAGALPASPTFVSNTVIIPREKLVSLFSQAGSQ